MTQKSAKKVDFALEPTICKTAGSEIKSGDFGGINTVQDFINPYTDNTFTNISLNHVIKEQEELLEESSLKGMDRMSAKNTPNRVDSLNQSILSAPSTRL